MSYLAPAGQNWAAGRDVEFVQSPDDLHALWRYYLLRMPERRRHRYAGFLVACLPLAIVAGMIALIPRPWPIASASSARTALFFAALAWPVLIAAMIPVYVAWAHSPAGVRWRVGRMIRRGQIPALFFGRKRLSLASDGFRVAGDGFETFLAWRHLPRVVADTDHLFLFQTYTPRGLYGHAIPRSSFASDLDFDHFCRQTESYWRSVRLEPEAPSPQYG